MSDPLIEPADLAARLGDAELAILDCRFDLQRPAWGAEAYAKGHIPGAQYAHLDHDLSGPIGPHTGRHPLPDPDVFAARAGTWGIDASIQVVAYDQGSGMFAARLWWLLRWLGHTKVAVLNGGWAAWQTAGLPASPRPARQFVARPDRSQWVDVEELPRARDSGVLVDARAADRFAGNNETVDPIAGHVPGAVNHPFARNLDAAGKFLPAEQLRASWSSTLGSRPPTQLVSMCGSGVTACHNLLALELAGLSGARLYAGSWSEWIRDPSRPVARGER